MTSSLTHGSLMRLDLAGGRHLGGVVDDDLGRLVHAA